MLRRTIAVAVLGAVTLAAPATASVTVATNAGSPALRVDSRGDAEVSWASGGRRQTLLVPMRGAVLPGGKLSGPDVSRPASSPKIPFQRVLRSGPGGWVYALQSWQVKDRGPFELRFSRWRGAPTTVALEAGTTRLGAVLTGVAKFGGKPVPTSSPTPAGTVQRQYVFLDAFTRGSWARIGGVATSSNGTFRRLVPRRQLGTQYRATLTGPNIGTTYAPDAMAVVAGG